MLCLPGLTPVANDAHAVGDSGDTVVPSGYTPPCLITRAKFGSRPSATHFSTRCASRPSKPRMTSFCEYLVFDVPPPHAMNAEETARSAAATTAQRIRLCIGMVWVRERL